MRPPEQSPLVCFIKGEGTDHRGRTIYDVLALNRMLAFYGLARNGDQIEALPELNPRDHIWLKDGGHNHLRITRMIRSLHYCHQPDLAKALQTAFVSLGQRHGQVGSQTVGYWLRATE